MVAIYILIGLFGGVLVAGMAFALVSFFRYVLEMKVSVDKLCVVLDRLSKDNTLSNALGSFQEVINIGRTLAAGMGKMHTTIDLFYRSVLRSEAIAAQAPAPTETGSAVYTYDEGRAAADEAQRKLRQAGVHVPEDKEIPADQATGAQV